MSYNEKRQAWYDSNGNIHYNTYLIGSINNTNNNIIYYTPKIQYITNNYEKEEKNNYFDIQKDFAEFTSYLDSIDFLNR
jgi:hypothetical protein